MKLKKNLNYISGFFSKNLSDPSGSYLYGTISQMESFYKKILKQNKNCGWGEIKKHKTMVNARNHCNLQKKKKIAHYLKKKQIITIEIDRIWG